MSLDLDGRRFSPIANSEGGHVSHRTVFLFSQNGDTFTATYSGNGVTDGHIIGRMTGENKADLIYHSRSEDGALDAGEAEAAFDENAKGVMTISMSWRWLNGSRASGLSEYLDLT